MREYSKLVSEMIFDMNSHIILVGSSKILPKYIDLTLIEILSKGVGKTEEEIRKYLNNMKSFNVYYTETW